MTVIVSVASVKLSHESVTRRVKSAVEAEQEATTSAVTLPELSTAMFETVTPFTVADALPLTVTVNEAGGSSLSLTVAICELELGAPCSRVTPDAAVIVGGCVSQTCAGPNAIASKPEIVDPKSVAMAVVVLIVTR